MVILILTVVKVLVKGVASDLNKLWIHLHKDILWYFCLKEDFSELSTYPFGKSLNKFASPSTKIAYKAKFDWNWGNCSRENENVKI